MSSVLAWYIGYRYDLVSSEQRKGPTTKPRMSAGVTPSDLSLMAGINRFIEGSKIPGPAIEISSLNDHIYCDDLSIGNHSLYVFDSGTDMVRIPID